MSCCAVRSAVGMGSDSKVHNSTAIMGEYQKDEQQPERCRRNDDEISRDNIVHVVLQECFPRLR